MSSKLDSIKSELAIAPQRLCSAQAGGIPRLQYGWQLETEPPTANG
ncbi:MAG: hypothetical protein JGK17_07790 [Microcoleus sp. PH2017_10_PVI_O_A]|nr:MULTISPECIES: hypothetical protein [unclassified Microcoleus]MCC3405483.1 hypothetical protein [Microcoleus sp. PH2017_10_PVI_O_A]MCC3461688.1 hypothetical protein [Microcoleus sp. PH2017_11_PCY_U_A]MCC3477585.1 hypothetical protein [Microcoleus sp. PH2017_12_PCY_D_A]MCC3528986.1 hypothetical protein [Microcoleus sp. PH2017_21_RUC_O_A]